MEDSAAAALPLPGAPRGAAGIKAIGFRVLPWPSCSSYGCTAFVGAFLLGGRKCEMC